MSAQMRRTRVAEGRGERQQRQQDFTAYEPNRLLSDEQVQYVDQVPVLQREAAADAGYNGLDAQRRVDPTTEARRLGEVSQ